MSKEKLFHVGVKGLIENKDGKILLMFVGENNPRYHSSYWDIPGGRIEEGKSALETLKREIEEETGVKKINKAKLFISVISKHEFPLNDRMLGLVLVIYKVEIPDNSKIQVSGEHEKYEWVNKKVAAKRLASKYPSEFTNLLS